MSENQLSPDDPRLTAYALGELDPTEQEALERLLADSQRGILFSTEVAERAAPLLTTLLAARGFQRVHQFLSLLNILAQSQDNTLLATPTFRPDIALYQSSTINQVLAHLAEHLGDSLCESDLARFAGMEASAFSRFFRRHTGVPFIQYLNRLRVSRACELLIASGTPITEICYTCGFNNVSNFNRRFLAAKSMPPWVRSTGGALTSPHSYTAIEIPFEDTVRRRSGRRASGTAARAARASSSRSGQAIASGSKGRWVSTNVRQKSSL